ncbi:hypothetical protein M885DRAFT_494721 [Pelagophyceae sp. CCMP2097]|nr:hypothetical protein M885DRAFT_494721 [Pelagophyceae sp. CCMP2097]
MEDNFKANSSLRSDRLAHEWMDMRQKEGECVAGWQARVKKLARDFPKLTPTIMKSQSDIMEKFNRGLLGELRNMTWSMRLASRINSSNSKELALDKYNGFVISVKDAVATMQLSQEPNKQRALALLNRDGFKDNHKQEGRLALHEQDERKHADLKPLLKQTQPAYVKGFIGSCLVNTHIGIDANNAAPYTLNSEAFYRQYLEPMGEVLEGISDQGIKLIGAGCDEIKSLGIINELDVTLGSKKRPTPHIRIKVIVLEGDFSCDAPFNVDTIRKLGMVIDHSAKTPYITIRKLHPVLRIELGQEEMKSVAENNSTTTTLPYHARKITCATAVADLKEYIIPPRTSSYSVALSNAPSPKKTETMSLATNPPDEPVVFEVNTNIPPAADSAKKSDSTSNTKNFLQQNPAGTSFCP